MSNELNWQEYPAIPECQYDVSTGILNNSFGPIGSESKSITTRWYGRTPGLAEIHGAYEEFVFSPQKLKPLQYSVSSQILHIGCGRQGTGV